MVELDILVDVISQRVIIHAGNEQV